MEVTAKHGRIGAIVESMRAQIEELVKDRDEAAARQEEAETEISRLEDAVRSLLGKPAAAAPSLRTPTQSRVRTKRKGDTLTAEEIEKKVQAWISWEGPLSEADLRDRVKREAAAQGRSAQGAHFVLRRVLSEGSFSESNGKWSSSE